MVRHPGPPVHFNCGVIFFRNRGRILGFIDEVMARLPGRRPWFEQQILNDLIAEERWVGIFERLDDRWNSTVNVNESPEPVVMGWHGVYGVCERALWMKAAL